MMVDYIDDRREVYGVELICRVLREALRRPTMKPKLRKLILQGSLRELYVTPNCERRFCDSGVTTLKFMSSAKCGPN